MLKALSEYTWATTVEDAWEAFQTQPHTQFLSGGVGIGLRDESQTERIIDLKPVLPCHYEFDDDEVRIGAGIRINDWLDATDDPLVIQALRTVGSNQIRNMATIGGSIAQHYSWSDICTLLVAIDSKVKVYDGQLSTMAIESYWGKKDRGIITEVILPRWATHGAYVKFSQTGYDIAYLNLAMAARMDKNGIQAIRVAVGARPGGAKLLSLNTSGRPKAMIHQDAIEKAVESADFGSNEAASAEYRKSLVITHITRFLGDMGR